MSYIVAMATEASEMAHSNITEASEKLTNEAKKIQKERNELEVEKEQWEDNKKMLERKSAFGPHVTLDVGGTRYKVSRATLTRNFPRSHMLSCMFSGLYPPADEQEEGGVFFIDRNGKVFEHVLEYLRIGSAAILPLRLHQEPQRSIMLYQIHEEAKYFQIPELMNDLRLIAGCDGITNLQQLLVPPASFARPGAYSCVGSGQLKWKLDHGPSKNEEITTTATNNLNYAYQRVRICIGVKCNQINFNDGSRFRFCDVSGVTFHQCNFGPRFDFTGSIMCGVKFERCTGLVTNMIRFSEKQLMESDMEEELVAALRKAGCTYDENKDIVTD